MVILAYVADSSRGKVLNVWQFTNITGWGGWPYWWTVISFTENIRVYHGFKQLFIENVIRLILDNFDMQDDTTVGIWLSKDSVGSEIAPSSLTDWAGLMSFPSGDNLKSSYFEDILRLPKTISFVLSGLSIEQLLKHQLRIRCKSELTLWMIQQSRSR